VCVRAHVHMYAFFAGICINLLQSPLEQLQEFATRLEASGMDLEAASTEASTSEQTEQQVLYQNSAQLISLFLEKSVCVRVCVCVCVMIV